MISISNQWFYEKINKFKFGSEPGLNVPFEIKNWTTLIPTRFVMKLKSTPSDVQVANFLG